MATVRRPVLVGALSVSAVVVGLCAVWVGSDHQAPQPPPPPAIGAAAGPTAAGPTAAGPTAGGPTTAGPTAPGAATGGPTTVAPSGVTPGAAAAPPATPAEVTTRLRQLLGKHRGAQASIAALDLTGDRRYNYPAGAVIRTSGVVKLDILETVLLHAQQSGHPLDAADTASATAMIERDDNDGADTLWDKYGGAEAFRAANRDLGTRHTSPDTDRYWGLATSDADDQLTLLRNLVQDRPLDNASRAFALGLLAKVEPAQAWGVNAAADRGSSPLLKTGSINADNDNGLWTAGSVGIIQVRGHRVMLAVLTQHNRSRQDGIDLVNGLATTAVAAVAGPSPTAR